jgi:hypothetical protein
LNHLPILGSKERAHHTADDELNRHKYKGKRRKDPYGQSYPRRDSRAKVMVATRNIEVKQVEATHPFALGLRHIFLLCPQLRNCNVGHTFGQT